MITDKNDKKKTFEETYDADLNLKQFSFVLI